MPDLERVLDLWQVYRPQQQEILNCFTNNMTQPLSGHLLLSTSLSTNEIFPCMPFKFSQEELSYWVSYGFDSNLSARSQETLLADHNGWVPLDW